MKNILFLTASPTVGGNGDTLINAAIEEAKSHEVKVHIVHVREKKIGFCKACYGCAETGVCVQKDDFMDILRLAHEADVKYIAEPGGSIRDDHVIMTCNKYNMAMAFTGIRLFHH